MTARTTGKGAAKAAPAKDRKGSKGSAPTKKAAAGKTPRAAGSTKAAASSKGGAASKAGAGAKAGASSKAATGSKSVPGAKPSAGRPAPKPGAAKADTKKAPEARKGTPASTKASKARTPVAPAKPGAHKGAAVAASKPGAGTPKAAPPPKAEAARKAGAAVAAKPAAPKPRAERPDDGKHPAPAKPKPAAAAVAVAVAGTQPKEAKRARPEETKAAEPAKTPPAAPSPKAAEGPVAKVEPPPAPPAPPAPPPPEVARPRPGYPGMRPGEEPPPPPKRYPPPRPPRKLDLTRPKPVLEEPEKGDLPYPVLRRGKVREVYQIDRSNLLILTSDRVSAFDVVMKEPIPRKGEVLTQLTAWWLARLETKGVEHHLISVNPDQIVELHPDLAKTRKQWERRAMLVRKTEPVPIECVVRGYLAGSAWKDYEETRLLAGERLPEELLEGQRLPRPMWAPATKALDGHDDNVTPLEVRMALGEQLASRLERLALRIYDHGRRACEGSGIILADTKYEFGLDLEGRLLLIDEVMTPDSSRFWPKQSYAPGKTQPSLDKQPIRDWLESQPEWDKKPPPPKLPPTVVSATTERYLEIFRRLTGTTLDEFQPPLMRSAVP